MKESITVKKLATKTGLSPDKVVEMLEKRGITVSGVDHVLTNNQVSQIFEQIMADKLSKKKVLHSTKETKKVSSSKSLVDDVLKKVAAKQNKLVEKPVKSESELQSSKPVQSNDSQSRASKVGPAKDKVADKPIETPKVTDNSKRAEKEEIDNTKKDESANLELLKKIKGKSEEKELDHTKKYEVNIGCSVDELASVLSITANDLIINCFKKRLIITKNQKLDNDALQLIASELDISLDIKEAVKVRRKRLLRRKSISKLKMITN